MSITSKQQNYLLRQQSTSSPGFFNWLQCCPSTVQLERDFLPNRNTISIKKIPLKRKTLTNNEESYRNSTKEIGCRAQHRNTTEIIREKNFQIQPLTLKFHSGRVENIFSNQSKKNTKVSCAVRFSYPSQKSQISEIDEMFNDLASAQKHETTKGTVHFRLEDTIREDSKQFQIKQDEQLMLRNTSTSKYSEESSPLRKKSSSKLTSKKSKRSNDGGRFSLSIRQAVSIREPEYDSDHESIVIGRSDDGLFGLLKPIKQSDKDSHNDCL